MSTRMIHTTLRNHHEAKPMLPTMSAAYSKTPGFTSSELMSSGPGAAPAHYAGNVAHVTAAERVASQMQLRRSGRQKKQELSFSHLLAGEEDEESRSSHTGDDDGGADSWDDQDPKRRRRRNSSHVPVNYRGVTLTGSQAQPWKATINHRGAPHEIGCYTTEVEAARAYDEMARRLHGEKARLNFPKDGERSRMGKSLYRGISWQAKCNKFEARLKFGGKMRYIGVFTDEKEAAQAWDMEALRMRGQRVKRLNFPEKEAEYIATLQASGEWPGGGTGVVAGKKKAPEVAPSPPRPGPAKRRSRPSAHHAADSTDSEDAAPAPERMVKRPRHTEKPVEALWASHRSRRSTGVSLSPEPHGDAERHLDNNSDQTLSMLSHVAEQYPILGTGTSLDFEDAGAHNSNGHPAGGAGATEGDYATPFDDRMRSQLVDIMSRNGGTLPLPVNEDEGAQRTTYTSPYFGAAAMIINPGNLSLTVDTVGVEYKTASTSGDSIFTMTHGREMISPAVATGKGGWYLPPAYPQSAATTDTSSSNPSATPSNGFAPPIVDIDSIRQVPSYLMGAAFQDVPNSVRNAQVATSPMAFLATFSAFLRPHTSTATSPAAAAMLHGKLAVETARAAETAPSISSDSCRSSAGSIPSGTSGSKTASDDALQAARLLTHMNEE